MRGGQPLTVVKILVETIWMISQVQPDSDESVSEFDNMQRGDICRSTIFKQSKPDKNLTIAYRSCFGLTFAELAPGQFSL